MSPCTAPTFTTVPAPVPGCGCASATEPGSVPVLVPILVAVAAFVWARQRWGPRPVLLRLARPEAEVRHRIFSRPRLVLSDRERRALSALRELFERAPRPALVPLRAATSRRSTNR
jgi:MYXO-CTERM domain-containing protein